MHYLQLLSIFIATVASTGFTIPEDQPDGVYKVSFDAGGHATHTLIGDPVNHTDEAIPTQPIARSISGKFRLFARQSDAVACGGYDLDHQNTDDALEALKNQCNPGAVGGKLDFYSIAGGTVAYVCNFSGLATICTRNEIGGTADRITGVCGSYRAGWRTTDGNGRNIQIGYERTGSRFCGRGV